MGRVRAISRVFEGVPTVEGAGVRLRRAFGHSQLPLFDPFLLLDDFGSDDPADYLPGFPWHPHRGIETITYMLAGRVAHGDSLGNAGTIGPGDVQWMTAGRGIVHQEMPLAGESPRLRGLQLWANLPAAHKMMPPRYRDVRRGEIPTVRTSAGARVAVVCGEVEGVHGPVRDVVIDPTCLDVALPAHKGFRMLIPRGHTVFAYVFAGEADFGEGAIGEGHVVLLGDGDEVNIEASGPEGRFLLVAGMPLGEPVAWRGPIVMNTEAELRAAFDDYRRGTFVADAG
jgi:quercetin 2,3-dioxygenase